MTPTRKRQRRISRKSAHLLPPPQHQSPVLPRRESKSHQQILDYIEVSARLLLQRLIIYIAALTLTGFYYSWPLSLLFIALIVSSELYDYLVVLFLRRKHALDPVSTKTTLLLIYVGSAFSTTIISAYAITVSYFQGPVSHFMPIFFLVAAALFAAMYSHQLVTVLIIRFTGFGTAFLWIPVWDIYHLQAPIASEVWVHLFTNIFVLFFIIDCSRVYRRLYTQNMLRVVSLKRRNVKMKEIADAKTRFLSIISHELRTPLTSIKGSIDLMNVGLLGEVPGPFVSPLKIAARNADRLNKLIDDLLDQQSLETGKMTFHFVPVLLNLLVPQVAQSNQPFADQFGVRILLNICDRKAYVNADAQRLEQALSNIISNAIKFSPPDDEITISLFIDDEWTRIEIKDRGRGISEKDREKVFGLFTQVDSSDRRRVGGTGLGMNISKAIVEAHGGRLDYQSSLGQGTSFYADFPTMSSQDAV